MERTRQETAASQLRRLFEGPLLDAFSDPAVTDIHVDPDGSVFTNTHDGRRGPHAVLLPATIHRALRVLAELRGVELEADPLFGTDFPDVEPFARARLQCALPPVCAKPVLSIRRHAAKVFKLEDFDNLSIRSPHPPPSRTLHRVVEESLNVLVFGATSTGKTALLSALLKAVSEIFPTERIVILEDTPELRVSSADKVALQTKPPRLELHDLLRTALRMNPDRIVIGEVRGPEALDLIDAFSTGHRGGFATIHADTPEGALRRLEHLAHRHRAAGRADLRPTLAAAIDIVVELRRGDKPGVFGIHRLSSDLGPRETFQFQPYGDRS